MTKTLQEVAGETGIAYQLLKKHVQRGKLRATTVSGRIMVEDDDLDAYLLVTQAGEALRSAEGEPVEVITRDLGNVIANLPQHVRDAILAGIPTGKKAGSPEPYRAAIADVPKRKIVSGDEHDPHRGAPIGYQHDSSPRWKRISDSTWKLGNRTYSWNGFGWEPGGEAKDIGDGVSPADPDASRRPVGGERASASKRAPRAEE